MHGRLRTLGGAESWGWSWEGQQGLGWGCRGCVGHGWSGGGGGEQRTAPGRQHPDSPWPGCKQPAPSPTPGPCPPGPGPWLHLRPLSFPGGLMVLPLQPGSVWGGPCPTRGLKPLHSRQDVGRRDDSLFMEEMGHRGSKKRINPHVRHIFVINVPFFLLKAIDGT